MNLTESIIEDAALTWFGELVPQSRKVWHGPPMAPGEPASRDRGRDSFGEVLLVGRLREALWQWNPGISQSRTLATLRDMPLRKWLSGELQTQI